MASRYNSRDRFHRRRRPLSELAAISAQACAQLIVQIASFMTILPVVMISGF